MSRWFALGIDGIMYDLCDCGDIEAAEESAQDVLPDGIGSIWLADEQQALEWAARITTGCADAASIRHKKEYWNEQAIPDD